MRLSVLTLVAALAIQQLPAPFATPWFRKATRVVPMPDGHRLTVPAGFAVNVFADTLQFRAIHGARARTATCSSPSRCGARARSRSCATRITTAWPRRARRSRPVSTGRSASRSGRTISTSATTTRSCGSPTAPVRLDGDGAAGEDRRSAAERRRARSGHREAPEDRHQPDARLQPLDAQRHLQSGRHQACTSRSDRPPTRRRRADAAARRHQRVQPRRQRPSRVRERTPQSGRPRVLSGHRHALDGGQRARSPRRRPRARLHHVGASERCVLRLAVLVHRPAPRSDRRGRSGPDLVAKAIAPDVLLPSHSAALGLIFYTGTQFPTEYRNSAFVALHGSINRSKLSGYSVVRVRSATAGQWARPKNFSQASSRAMTTRRRRGDVRSVCCSCPTARCSCPTTAAIVSGVSVTPQSSRTTHFTRCRTSATKFCTSEMTVGDCSTSVRSIIRNRLPSGATLKEFSKRVAS